jgi:hypothetical protein
MRRAIQGRLQERGFLPGLIPGHHGMLRCGFLPPCRVWNPPTIARSGRCAILSSGGVLRMALNRIWAVFLLSASSRSSKPVASSSVPCLTSSVRPWLPIVPANPLLLSCPLANLKIGSHLPPEHIPFLERSQILKSFDVRMDPEYNVHKCTFQERVHKVYNCGH